MQYQINAWLEKENPALKIFDPDKNQVIREFQGKELEGLIEQGDIIPEELMTTNENLLESLIDELLTNHSLNSRNEYLNKNALSHQTKRQNLFGLVEKAKTF